MTRSEFYSDIEHHLLYEEIPSTFFNVIYDNSIFKEYPFDDLYKLKSTEQSKKHHPEGSVWNHTMMVIDEAAKIKNRSRDKKVFMWSALLHDIGKPATTKNIAGKITSYEHEKIGAKMAKDFLSCFSDDIEFIDSVSMLVKWHTQIMFITKNLPYAEIDKMKESIDVEELALLGLCDRLGRLGSNRVQVENTIKYFIEKCKDS